MEEEGGGGVRVQTSLPPPKSPDAFIFFAYGVSGEMGGWVGGVCVCVCVCGIAAE